jgi:hypothetical protein
MRATLRQSQKKEEKNGATSSFYLDDPPDVLNAAANAN